VLYVQSSILELVQETGNALEKVPQVAAATIAGVSQGQISQVAAKNGGWKAYKKLLAVFVNFKKPLIILKSWTQSKNLSR
jgi:hypothetical protein